MIELLLRKWHIEQRVGEIEDSLTISNNPNLNREYLTLHDEYNTLCNLICQEKLKSIKLIKQITQN